MSLFNSYDVLMGTAETQTTIASVPLPTVIPVAFMFKASKGAPANLETAAKAWETAAQSIEKTKTMLQERLGAISQRDWDAADRRAYEAKVQEFVSQLDAMQVFCQAVQIALLVFAWALMAFAIFAIALGTFLSVLAGIALAALLSVVGAPVYASCVSLASTSVAITGVATGILAAAASLAAVVFQGGSMLAAFTSYQRGNEAALTDFTQAQMNGSATALTNLAQNAVNAPLAFIDSRGGGSSPLSEIDLDADRDADGIWTAGGGATFETAGQTEITGGAHVQWGDDEGFVGGDVSGGVSTQGGWSAEGEVGYTDSDGVGQGDAGTLNYSASGGYEAENGSGHNYGGTVGVEGEHDFESGDGSTSVSATGTYNGGDVAGYTQNYQYSGDGQSHWNGNVNTPVADIPVGDETPPWDQ
ncbi:hypothetical protein [Actinomadura sp. WAC 06369]|uniref:hypothetical protein n=1 Tax=Actinomadura sp. WAC 06369 TaxID=2203193 RepID=UPI000F794476|nr:hypothetical protein [Actinomadura sp. WAC 06369]RSN60273.1 hypothetical protein DMH08_20935 [Actinomadura sp. WAC 06369]